jgi:steroid delta-isomerase-like uncharacterized protein
MLNHKQLTLMFALLGAAIPGAMAQVPTEIERNRAVVREHLDLINRGEWKQAAELYSPDTRHNSGTSSASGPVAAAVGLANRLDVLKDILTTFPDWKMQIVDMIAEGDTVVVRCRVSGTHLGVGRMNVNGGYLVGVPPTGKHFEVQAIHWFKLREGKIVEHFVNRDDLGMTRQLGLLPPPSGTIEGNR